MPDTVLGDNELDVIFGPTSKPPSNNVLLRLLHRVFVLKKTTHKELRELVYRDFSNKNPSNKLLNIYFGEILQILYGEIRITYEFFEKTLKSWFDMSDFQIELVLQDLGNDEKIKQALVGQAVSVPIKILESLIRECESNYYKKQQELQEFLNYKDAPRLIKEIAQIRNEIAICEKLFKDARSICVGYMEQN